MRSPTNLRHISGHTRHNDNKWTHLLKLRQPTRFLWCVPLRWYRRWSLIFLGQRLNFWGKSGISYEQYDKINTTWTARLPSGREMPLALSRETLREYTTAAAQVDRAAAEQLLRDRLAEALALQLGDGEAVRTDYTVRERNGVLEVTLLAECREEIGRFVPWEGVQPQ